MASEVKTTCEQIIAEEYKIWRKGVPYNYDLLLSHSLVWPTLTVQFFPSCERNNNMTSQNLLYSTHTSGNDSEYLTIGQVHLPDEITDAALENFNHSDLYGDGRIKTIQKIPVLDEINRARYSVFANNVIAARSDKPDVHVYDITKHRSFTVENESQTEKVMPDLILDGHEDGGFGLSWSTNVNGQLVTCGNDGFVCLYDINKDLENKKINPINKLKLHTTANDCQFSFHKNTFASVGEDKKIILCDARDCKPRIKEDAHDGEIFCVSFSNIEEYLLATGGDDGKIKIWDERKMDQCVYSFDTGSDNHLLALNWSPHMGNLLASSGSNRRVCIWDLSKVGMELTPEEINDGPAELLFMHGGHTNTVCDFAWNPLEPFEIVSVAEDNIMQIWQMTNSQIPCDAEDE